MTKQSDLIKSLPYPVEMAIKTLGANLKTARLRRNLTIKEVADRIGLDRRSVSDAERGKPSASIAVYVATLWALGLIDDLSVVGDPSGDSEGLTVAAQRDPKRVRTRETLDNDF